MSEPQSVFAPRVSWRFALAPVAALVVLGAACAGLPPQTGPLVVASTAPASGPPARVARARGASARATDGGRARDGSAGEPEMLDPYEDDGDDER